MGLVAAQATRTTGAVVSASADTIDLANLRDVVNTFAVLTDVARTVTVTHVFTPTQTFTGGLTAGAAVTVSAGNITATAGNVAITAGNLTFAAASAKVIPGATSLLFRNNADSASNIAVTDAGAVTVRAGLTVTASGLTVTAGTSALQAVTATTVVPSTSLGFSSASGKILIGATNLLFRDSADASTFITMTTTALTLASTVGFSCGGGVGLGSIGCSNANVTLGGNTNGSVTAQAGSGGFVEVGVPLATNATSQHFCIPSVAGVSTGVPTTPTSNMIAFHYDRTNNKLSAYNGAWRQSAAFA